MASRRKSDCFVSHRTILEVKQTSSSEAFQCEPIFNRIEETLKKEGESYVKRVRGVFALEVTDGPGGKTETWVIDVKNGSGSLQRGGKVRADCTIRMKDQDIVDIAQEKQTIQAAFFSGKMKIKGNMAIALKLQKMFPIAKL